MATLVHVQRAHEVGSQQLPVVNVEDCGAAEKVECVELLPFRIAARSVQLVLFDESRDSTKRSIVRQQGFVHFFDFVNVIVSTAADVFWTQESIDRIEYARGRQ